MLCCSSNSIAMLMYLSQMRRVDCCGAGPLNCWLYKGRQSGACVNVYAWQLRTCMCCIYALHESYICACMPLELSRLKLAAVRWLPLRLTSLPPHLYCGLRPKGLHCPTTFTTRAFHPEIGQCVFHRLHSAGVWRNVRLHGRCPRNATSNAYG